MLRFGYSSFAMSKAPRASGIGSLAASISNLRRKASFIRLHPRYEAAGQRENRPPRDQQETDKQKQFHEMFLPQRECLRRSAEALRRRHYAVPLSETPSSRFVGTNDRQFAPLTEAALLSAALTPPSPPASCDSAPARTVDVPQSEYGARARRRNCPPDRVHRP